MKNMQTIHTQTSSGNTANGGGLPVQIHVDGGAGFSSLLLPAGIVAAIIILIVLIILIIREYNLQKNKKKNV